MASLSDLAKLKQDIADLEERVAIAERLTISDRERRSLRCQRRVGEDVPGERREKVDGSDGDPDAGDVVAGGVALGRGLVAGCRLHASLQSTR